MLTLKSPLKWATTRTGWHHEIKTLDEFKRCITQDFGNYADGYYSKYGCIGHNGVDVAINTGDPIYASHDGIAYTGIDANKGLGVTIVGKECKTIYWHDLDFTVTNGQEVRAGDLIAHGDNTGDSTGPHLHWGMKLLINGEVKDRDNGYDGAVDPMLFITYDDMKITKEMLPLLYRAIFYREPDTDFWVGHDINEFLNAVLTQEEWPKVRTLIEAARNLK